MAKNERPEALKYFDTLCVSHTFLRGERILTDQAGECKGVAYITHSLIELAIMAGIELERYCGHGQVVCEGPVTGICYPANALRQQALYGSSYGPNLWEKAQWKAYVKRVRRKVLPHCGHPDQLLNALQSIRPNFVEDQRKEGSK